MASSLAPFSNANAVPNVYGMAPPSLKRWRFALSKALSGQSNARIVCVGDSTTFGVGSNNSASGDMNVQSYPTQLAKFMTSFGVPAVANSWFGDSSAVTTARTTNDARIVAGSSWAPIKSAGVFTLGGLVLAASTITNALAYTPAVSVDTFRVWVATITSGGVIQGQIGAGTPVTLNTAAATGITSFTVTGTLGTNTLNLTWSSGGSVNLIGIEAWNSALPQVIIANAGWSGSAINDINSVNTGTSSKPFGPLAAALALAPDLYIVDIGINDWLTAGSGLTPAQYAAALTTYLQALYAVGDVLLVSPATSQITQSPLATQGTYVTAMQNVASNLGIPFIDNWTRMGAWENNTAEYCTYSSYQPLHPNMIGYADFAKPIAQALARL